MPKDEVTKALEDDNGMVIKMKRLCAAELPRGKNRGNIYKA